VTWDTSAASRVAVTKSYSSSLTRRTRDNPAAVHRVLGERYRLSAFEWSLLLHRFEVLGRRAAIIGGHGSGKTTLLEDLGERLHARGWGIHLVRVNADRPKLSELPDCDDHMIVLCDGAEQLNFFEWRRLRNSTRTAGGLVITMQYEGRLPTLHHCHSSPAVIRELAASLGYSITPAEGVELHTRHDGNVRSALRELYDTWSRGG